MRPTMRSTLTLSLACLLGTEAFGPPGFGSPMRLRRPIAMSAVPEASPAAGLGGLGSKVPLLGQDGPLLPRKAGSDEAAQLTASATILGVVTACMGTAYAKMLKAAVTLTWKRG